MRRDEWTAERIELLRRLWAEGATAGAIAARLGDMSRSAVLGKIFRLRLDAVAAAARPWRNETKENGPRAAIGGATPSPHGIELQFAHDVPLARRRRSKENKPDERLPAAGAGHKTLLELTDGSCRWPHGRPGTKKFFFCGAARADLEHGIPYCPRHMRRAYLDPDGTPKEEQGAAFQRSIAGHREKNACLEDARIGKRRRWP